MAEPIRPSDESDEQGRHVAARPIDAPPAPAGVDEDAAARRDLGSEAAEPAAADRTDTDTDAVAAITAPSRPVAEPEEAAVDHDEVREEPAATSATEPTPARLEPTQTAVIAPPPPPVVPVAPEPQPVIAPAAQTDAAPLRRRGNRVAGTAWALLAAGLFQVFYFAALAGLSAALSGPASVIPFLTAVVQARWGVFAWLPVLFLFLLHELTVLIAGRAGRFFWVVASGVIAVLVYALSVVLISIVVRGAAPDAPTLAQTFLNPTFILIGVVGREVVLWTGFAAGARGVRVRRRDREDRERYDRDLAARTGTTA